MWCVMQNYAFLIFFLALIERIGMSTYGTITRNWKRRGRINERRKEMGRKSHKFINMVDNYLCIVDAKPLKINAKTSKQRNAKKKISIYNLLEGAYRSVSIRRWLKSLIRAQSQSNWNILECKNKKKNNNKQK